MKITLSPVASNRTSSISVNGERITVDGQEFDLSALPNNSVCEATYPAVGNVKKQSGEIDITIAYHYDSARAETNQPANIEAYRFNITNGIVPCPILWRPIPEVIVYSSEDNGGSFDA